MTPKQFRLLALTWTVLVLAPFAALFVSLKETPQLAIMGFFLLFVLAHRFHWRLMPWTQAALLWLVVFSSLTTLSYQLFIVIAPSCNPDGECVMPVSQGVLATATGVVCASGLLGWIWKRGTRWSAVLNHLPFMLHAAGATVALAFVTQRVLWYL